MEKTKSSDGYSFKRSFFFGLIMIPENSIYQTFSFLIFSYYFAIAGLNVDYVTIGFVIWSIWNAFNDPMLGHLSDRTRTKWGRRKPWIAGAALPIATIMILLLTPPNTNNQEVIFTYFLIIICLFELFYTMFSINHIALFPELFKDEKVRLKSNNVRQIVSIFGLIVAFVMPTFIVPDLTDPAFKSQFVTIGIIVAVIILVFTSIFLKMVPQERIISESERTNKLSFFKAMSTSLKNKAFLRYIPTNLATWYVFGILPTIIPFYGRFVLGMDKDSLGLGLMFGVSFLVAAITMPFWAWISKKIGAKKSWVFSLWLWILGLIPLAFINKPVFAFITLAFVGFAMSGTLLLKDIIFGAIIDSEEAQTGFRRDAGYYGIDAFFARLGTILVFISINLVFNSIGWRVYDPTIGENVVPGIKLLMVVFPASFLAIGSLFMMFFPLSGKKLEDIKIKLANQREE
jgi:glycoside/pentoside/hexuronide:cation symporter, GPH family